MTEPAWRQTPDRQTSPPPPPPRASGAQAGLGLTSWAELHDRRMQEPGAVEAYQEAVREMEAEAKLAEWRPAGVFAPPPPGPAANLDAAIRVGVAAAIERYAEVANLDDVDRYRVERAATAAVRAAAPILQVGLDQLRASAAEAQRIIDRNEEIKTTIRWNQERADNAERRCRKLTVEVDEWKAQAEATQAEAEAVLAALEPKMGQLEQVLRETHGAVERLVQERDEAKAAIRRAHKAIRDGAVDAGTVALALFKVGDTDEPSILDERDEARRALELVTAERDALQAGWDNTRGLLDKAVRERDSLARRCAVRFEENEVIRGRLSAYERLETTSRALAAAWNGEVTARHFAEVAAWLKAVRELPAQELTETEANPT